VVDTSNAKLMAVLAGFIYAGALVVLVGAGVRWIRTRLASPGQRAPARSGAAAGPLGRFARFWRWARWAWPALALLVALCVLWARLVEPFWPQVERVRIETDRLPAGTGPVRLVLLADTHCDPAARAEPRIPGIVRELEPDAIVFAGDAINSPEGLPHFRRLMKQLAEIAPTYAVRGNWEIWWFREVDFYSGTGVSFLEDRAIPVRSGGAEVWLCGAPPLTPGEPPPALSLPPEGRFKILVHHYPEVGAEVLGAGRADLALGGDTHGGQVRLPLLGPAIKISRCGGYFDVGLHRIGRGHLYVNRGIGMEGGRAPRVRFMCRPEVTLIEISPAGAKR
jgi:predicted MPP superfamily phosphohydrolase